jgi:hypothetical protein
MGYTRRKIGTKRSRKSRRNKRSRSYRKGGQFNTPPRGANGVRSSAAYGQQQYGQQQQNYSPVQGNNLMGAFNAASPGSLSGRYNQSGQFSPTSVAYPGYN